MRTRRPFEIFASGVFELDLIRDCGDSIVGIRNRLTLYLVVYAKFDRRRAPKQDPTQERVDVIESVSTPYSFNK